uniref:Uncharacterized protein n=1 Tax=Scleropages formosus TaxID=113540 RepID=A0A8C9TGF4_SCLFO
MIADDLYLSGSRRGSPPPCYYCDCNPASFARILYHRQTFRKFTKAEDDCVFLSTLRWCGPGCSSLSLAARVSGIGSDLP